MGTIERTTKAVTIVMADDDRDDRMLVKDAFAETYPACGLDFVENGEELLDYLAQRGKGAPYPGLILLDLNMPRMDGREALAEIKRNRNLRRIPVVIFTTSRAENDIRHTYDLGASSFITKPVTFEGLLEVIRAFGKYWTEIVELPCGRALPVPQETS